LQLQLEPTALRQPSAFSAEQRLQPNGEGLAATLFRIARASKEPDATYARIANRLAELVSNVNRIDVERNEKLELLTLMLTDREGTILYVHGDTGHALRLLVRSNAVVLEWLGSPVIYRRDEAACAALAELARESAHLPTIAYHYDRLARRHWRPAQPEPIMTTFCMVRFSG